MRRTLIACGLLLASCGTPGAAYVKADRETFNAVAPDFQVYVLADPLLSQEQKDRRLLTIETWRKRLEAAEAQR